MFAKSIVVFMPTDENLYNGHLGDRILFNLKWPLWRGGGVIYMTNSAQNLIVGEFL